MPMDGNILSEWIDKLMVTKNRAADQDPLSTLSLPVDQHTQI